jgi:Domain of unknown function (DUF4136)
MLFYKWSRPMTRTFSNKTHAAKWFAVAIICSGLTGCATGFRADVARFQAEALPATQGQSFAIVADDLALVNSIEFDMYAAKAAERMSALGYRAATDTKSADLVVRMAYTVDKGTDKLRRSAGFYDPFWDSWGGFGRGYYHPRAYRSSFGYRYGYYDPFLFGSDGFDRVESIRVFTSALDLKIDRQADGKRLFEGKAEARSRDNDLTYLVPNLVDAMFTGFPGNSGQKMRITVAPKARK